MDIVFYLIKLFQFIIFIYKIIYKLIKSSIMVIKSILNKFFSNINKSYLNYISFKSILIDQKKQKSNLNYVYILSFFMRFQYTLNFKIMTFQSIVN